MDSQSAVAEACRRIGSKIPYWTQGTGGNVSLKHDGVLYIKASGLRLDAVTPDKGVGRANLKSLLSELAKCQTEEDYSNALNQSRLADSPRPSMEAGFHALLPHPCVLHFHSLVSLLMGHERAKNVAKFDKWAKGKMPIRFIPPTMPGLELSRLFTPQDETTAFVLQNHGVILQAESSDVIKEWAAFEEAFVFDWNYPSLKADGSRIAPCPLKLYFPDSAVFLERLQLLQDGRGGLAADCWKKDRDGSEIWQATSLLYHAQNELAELPPDISSRVSGLPTEKFRKDASA